MTDSRPSPPRTAAVRGGVILLLGLVLAAPAFGQTLPSNFVREQIVRYTGVGDPSGFAFLPDGRVLMIIRSQSTLWLGRVGFLEPTLLLTVPDVDASGFEEGMLGVVADPGWPARPYIYLCYSHLGGGVYVTMYEASGDLTNPVSSDLTLSKPYHVFTDIPNVTMHHQAGTLRFGGDGMLYISTGDDGFGCPSQDLGSLAGKILRVTVANVPGVGTGPPPYADLIPAGNPFSGPTDATRLLYAWGLRNPFRFTIDPATGDLFVGDVGEDIREEVDHIAAAAPGLNYGWPQREGFEPHPCCGGCGNGNPFTDPIYDYPHWGFGNSVIAGPRMRFVDGSASSFPANYDGSVFLAEYVEGWIRRLVPSGGGWAIAPEVAGQPSATNWAEGIAFITDLQWGVDGALYHNVWSGGINRGVWRIRPAGGVSAADLAAAGGARSGLRVTPNPAPSGATRFTFDVTGAGGALDVLDARGRVLRTWAVGRGAGALAWDGTASTGRALAAGFYFVRLREGDTTRETAKVTIVR